MSTAYTIVTLVTAFLTGSAAVFYLIGHEYPKSQADMKRIPRRYVPVLGSLLAAGTAGLLTGFAVPPIGTAAAVGLVLYFSGALVAHLRVGSRNLLGWAIFFVTVVTDLAVNLLHLH
ncbi:membrane protein [Actinoplanes philippinensis]|uniref:DoxX-like family protein n=1 Tax=Actinoplanes philippinensis TaxID=35752 RepID=A0A1I2EDR9_9ACTN|nr:DoxX family protein [Actinoplanes philippinensis]GIE77077.1 membrane protein [Actinoplanes philippinensis]SFE90859.1 DoxX-like family protein [Actinoplanes philippinensis]